MDIDKLIKEMKKESEAPELSLKQELFCKYYTSDSDTFGNKTLSYALAYGYDFDTLDKTRQVDEKGKEIEGTSERDRAYQYCASAGVRMVRLEKVNRRIKALMADKLDDDELVDAKLIEIVKTAKPADAISAIKHRNELKSRIIKKIDVNLTTELAQKSDEELLKMVEKEETLTK